MMDNEFYPPRRTGLLIQGGLALALSIAGGYFFFQAVQEPSGLDFLMDMLNALVIFAPLPLLVFRLYALLNGVYVLGRDGLMIRWGVRREDIPLNEIEWIRPATELGYRLPLPWLRWPGAIRGTRKVPELGEVEFMAADLAHMILIATPDKVFAISPLQANQFMALFQRIAELGSLTPLEAQSVHPQVIIGTVWEDRLARLLILASFGVGLVLFALVVIAVPGLETISWTEPGATAPAERLLLLPILAGIIWLLNMVVGIFLHRQGRDLRLAAYLLWGSAALTGLLLLLGSLRLIF
jgi:hypothetical protein